MNKNNKLALNAIRAYKAKALKDSKDAKPEGDKVKAYNNALTYAKKENKPFIYGYTNRNGKFFAADTPMKVSGSPVDAEKEFRKRYKNCSVVYVAYPDKEFIKDEKIDVETSDTEQMSEDYIPHGVDLINGEYDPTIPSEYHGPKRSYFTYKGINVYKTGDGYGSYTISGFDKKATYYLTNIKQVKDFINNHLHADDSLKDEKIDVEKELLANHFKKRECKPSINRNDICYYDYKGTGYFPEIVARLQNKLGKFDYVGETNRIVGIRHKHESLKDDATPQDYWELATSSSKSGNFDTEEEAREVLEEDRQRAIKMLKESKLKNHYAYEFICKYVDDELEDYNIGYLLIKINGVVKDYTHDYGYDLDLYDADEQIEEIIDNLVEETSSNVKDANLYIYQFPASMTKEDMKEAKKYGLEILGKVSENGFQPGDWIIQGTLKQLEKFCDESLGYVMHPDYLYKSKEFDIEDVLVKDEALGEVQVDEFAEEEPNVSKKIEHQGKWTKYEINGQEMTVEQFLEEYDAGNLPELDAIYPESGGFKISIEEVRKLPKDTMGRFTIYDEIEEDDEFGPFTRRLLWFLIEGI